MAGGKATRLYPVTQEIPKSLVPINNIPFITHQINLFKRNGISDVVLCVGMFSDQIVNYLGDGYIFGVSIKYSIENATELLGTLGALIKAYDLLSDVFFVTYGDSYLETDYQQIYDEFLHSNKMGLMTVYKNKNKFVPSNTSIRDGVVTRYDKSNSDDFEYVDYGLSIFRKKALDFFPKNKNLDLTLLNQKLISMKELAAYEVDQKFYEIGTFEGITDLESHLKSK
ncbi:MAG: sugar phosphate nucleotidyltransferase [Nitrosotalea sp.]